MIGGASVRFIGSNFGGNKGGNIVLEGDGKAYAEECRHW